MEKLTKDLAGRSIAASIATLWTAVIVAAALVAPVAALLRGPAGVAASAAAALACLAGATLALVFGRLLIRGRNGLTLGLLAGMVWRMGIPLGIGLAVQLRGGPLAEAGLMGYLLVFYPITLAVEVSWCE